jgi:virginiamycin B lyase
VRVSHVAAGALVALAILRTGAASARVQQPAPEESLPDGPGRKILQTACSSCHELKEVTKFRGYYGANEWRDVVVTMIKYGAEVKDKEVEVLVDYLARNLGKKS